MGLEQRLTLRQSLQLRMTPQLRQAIKILQLARPELETMISEELCQNPALEEREPDTPLEENVSRTGDPESSESEAPDAETRDTDAQNLTEVDWREYLERQGSDFHGSVGAGSDRDDNRDRLFDNSAAPADALTDALIDQVGLVMMSEDERRLATVIIHNLNDEGYLAVGIDEIAAMTGSTEEAVQEAREIVQELEPPGCGSLDLAECLIVQLRLVGYEDDDYVILVVRDHLPDLEANRYAKIAKTLGTSTDEIVTAHRIIRTLDPRPGRNFGLSDTRYISPDAYIVRLGDRFEVVIDDEGLPSLQVSPYYKDVLKKGAESGEAKTYLQDKVRSASWLIRSIEQRQRTLRKVTESILGFQTEFLRHGVSHLKPMILKDVANDIGMHESTVSRATSGKYVHTPQGLFELKYFFTSSLRDNEGGDVSSESVKQKILAIISEEDRRKPFSDQYISDRLKKDNVDIARRTVAKYRESLGILPSSKRKRVVELD